MKSQWYKTNEGRFSKKMFILIAESCSCPKTFKKVDDRIETVGKLDEIRATRAGNIDRPYKIPVHQIKLDDGEVSLS